MKVSSSGPPALRPSGPPALRPSGPPALRPSGRTLILLSMVAALALPVPLGLSQAPPPRQHFILNLPVDPLHGDDALAQAQNPGLASYLAPHPAPPTALGPGGVLTQVPYPFRTVTAAITWINTTLGTLPAQNGNNYVSHVVIQCNPGLYGPIIQEPPDIDVDILSGLPWNGETFPIKIPDRVSIQGTSALNTIFDGRRLDEDFSIFTVDVGTNSQGFVRVFIDSVTIRGARGKPLGKNPGDILPGAGVMIDDPTPTPGQGLTIQLTVSNCFITDNDVGVAISSPSVGYHTEAKHLVRLINNTFAWNGIGVWNGGNARINQPNPQEATHKTMVVNCIFDSLSPLERSTINSQVSWYGNHSGRGTLTAGQSGFEGLSVYELTVESINGALRRIDYNAYELSRVNITEANTPGGPFLNYPGWPNVRVRPQGQGIGLNPRVDLTPYLQPPPAPPQATRFVLYHNDLFWWYGNTPGQPLLPDFDRSPHDFRILPELSPDKGNIWVVNPLIDRGLTLRMDVDDRSFELVMGYMGTCLQFQEMLEMPGIPSGYIPDGVNEVDNPGYGQRGSYADYATYFCNDWDCEGYGNPRNFNHPVAQPDPNFPNDFTDIGADEVGTLVIAGYINGTTIFSNPWEPGAGTLQPPPNNIENINVYFIGFRDTFGSRPRYNHLYGRSFCQTLGGAAFQPYDWWRYIWRDQPNMPRYSMTLYPAPLFGRYTFGEDNSTRPPLGTSWRRVLTQSHGGAPRLLEAFPAPLLCDFSPHLMMDISAFFGFPYDTDLFRPPNNWPLTWFRYDWHNATFKPPHQDAFSGNSWVRNSADDSQAPPPQNDQLEAGFGSDNENLFYVRNVCDTVIGVKNPPGTWLGVTTWLHFNLPASFPLDLTGSVPPLVDVSFNAWGIGDARLQDVIPSTVDPNVNDIPHAMGWRSNPEIPPETEPSRPVSNLQSFLAIRLGPAPETSKVPTGANTIQGILNRPPTNPSINPMETLRELREKKN